MAFRLRARTGEPKSLANPYPFVSSEVETRCSLGDRIIKRFSTSLEANGWKEMAHTDGTVSIRVNGEHRRVYAGLTIAQLAEELGLIPEKVAVERNLEVVPRSTLAQVCIEDGDEIEIVHFVGGG